MPTARAILVSSALLAASGPALGHHSAAVFDADQVVRIEGTVTRFDWKNPHVYIYVESLDGTGNAVQWEIETDWTTDLMHVGWQEDSLEVGERIAVRAHPGRNPGRHYANLILLEKQDGSILMSADLGEPPRVESEAGASGLQGRWLPSRGFPSFFQSSAAARNANGRLADEQYREEENPGNECEPHSFPTRLGMPHVNDIDVRDDRIVIRSETDDEPRTIFTDGRGHPDDFQRTRQGHSVGVWEDGVLVVDTVGFTDHRKGNGGNIPSGAGKHLVERYVPSEDGRSIELDYRLEDPEFLAGPVTGTFHWQYAPRLDLIPYTCDPEVAKRHLDAP